MRYQTQTFLNTTVINTHRILFTLNILVNMNIVNFQAGKRIVIFNSFASPKAPFCDKNMTFLSIIRSNSLNTLLLTHNSGRVTQICVFNTVKLGTSASSP